MAQSLNTAVELTVPATSYHALAVYGNMMVGDRALEFYNERNVDDYIQIPWDQIDHVSASVLFGGRSIPRFAVTTRSSGTFSFSTWQNKRVLRAVRDHIGDERVVRSLSFLDVVRLGLRRLLRRGA